MLDLGDIRPKSSKSSQGTEIYKQCSEIFEQDNEIWEQVTDRQNIVADGQGDELASQNNITYSQGEDLGSLCCGKVTGWSG